MSLTFEGEDEAAVQRLHKPIPRDELRIWVVDPEQAASAELNKKAERPSPLSRILTKEFFNLGQELILTTFPTSHNYETSFDVEAGYWTVNIYNVTTEIILTIGGRPITYNDLFIVDTVYTIEKRLDLSFIKALGYFSLKLDEGSNPLIVYHPCSASSALLLTVHGTFITHDGFITVEELKIVPTELQLREQNKVKTAAFLERNILFLIDHSIRRKHRQLQEACIGRPAEYLPVSPFYMHFIDSALPTVFIWSNNSVFYSLRNNSKSGKMTINGNEDLSSAVEGSSIHQIIFDHKLNIVIKMVNNLMLYGVVGINALLKLHVWERQDSEIILYSNLLSQIFVIKLVNSVINQELYPLQLEISSILFNEDLPGCPFRKFHHNMDLPVYYLDMGESLAFWSEIIYIDKNGLQLELIDYNKNLLHWTVDSDFQITIRFHTRNLSIVFRHVEDYSNSENYTAALKATSGVLTVEFQPNYIEYTCQLSSRRVSHINVGCPLKKHLRVERPSSSGCEISNITSYKIPGSVLRYPMKEDVEMLYDMKRYGCPIRVYYKSPFRPNLKLYLGDTFLRHVNANFILWEEQDRTDFYYNTTMAEAGCRWEAQTWDSMLELHKDTPIQDIWGPGNYRSCFESHGVVKNMDRPYEILNGTSSMYLTWPTDYTGVYVFSVKILDPNYSFCELTAQFAVETYGVLIRKDGTIVVSVVFSFIFLLLCSFAYSYNKYMKIFVEMLYFKQMNKYS
uniref:cation channel sperm-associated auxiliary subunit epsilon-like n=1 Tax=Pristiophorus japonicus TaxID=55135 RepID=UPI00398F2786